MVVTIGAYRVSLIRFVAFQHNPDHSSSFLLRSHKYKGINSREAFWGVKILSIQTDLVANLSGYIFNSQQLFVSSRSVICPSRQLLRHSKNWSNGKNCLFRLGMWCICLIVLHTVMFYCVQVICLPIFPCWTPVFVLSALRKEKINFILKWKNSKSKQVSFMWYSNKMLAGDLMAIYNGGEARVGYCKCQKEQMQIFKHACEMKELPEYV